MGLLIARVTGSGGLWTVAGPRPRVRKRNRAVERHATRQRLVQPREDVARGCREEDLHVADCVDDLPEPVEVHLEEVLDRNGEVLLERLDRKGRPPVRERGVE